MDYAEGEGIFLQQGKDNKANGYYERSLGSLFGNLELSVPRDRKGYFRPSIFPAQWKRYDANFQVSRINKKTYLYDKYCKKFKQQFETLRVMLVDIFNRLKQQRRLCILDIFRISKSKWRKPMPAVKEVIYELRQMFNSRFLNEIHFSKIYN